MDLQIRAGTFMGVAGPSGCGKSTLIKVIDKLEEAGGHGHCWAVRPLSSLSRRVLAAERGAGAPDALSSSPTPSTTTSATVCPDGVPLEAVPRGRPQGHHRRRH